MNGNKIYEDLISVDGIPNKEFGHGVYFISDTNGHIKIGKTNNLRRRLIELQTNQASELKVFQFYDCENEAKAYELESYFHKKFDFCRLKGEWFEEQPVMDFIVIDSGFWLSKSMAIGLVEEDKFESESERKSYWFKVLRRTK